MYYSTITATILSVLASWPPLSRNRLLLVDRNCRVWCIVYYNIAAQSGTVCRAQKIPNAPSRLISMCLAFRSLRVAFFLYLLIFHVALVIFNGVWQQFPRFPKRPSRDAEIIRVEYLFAHNLDAPSPSKKFLRNSSSSSSSWSVSRYGDNLPERVQMDRSRE